MAVSKVHSNIAARNVRQFEMTQITGAAVTALGRIGITMDAAFVGKQVKALFAGDAAFTPSITTGSVPTPIQFLQTWLPGFVKVMTSARKIDELVGIQTVGSWEDAEIVQGIVESSGSAAEYGDYTQVPFSSWNANFERRSVVRGELGIQVGVLEEKRAAAMRVSSAEEKRQAAGITLEILRNAIGFRGWSTSNNRTFGLLNDPALPAYVTLPFPGDWSGLTFLQLQSNIRFLLSRVRLQSQDQIDPKTTEITLALPTSKVDAMSTTSDFGISVTAWMKEAYPKVRTISAPEFVGANGGADVAYCYADSVDSSVDGSTDGGQVFAQLVQTKFMTVGVEKRSKSYVEDFANATAGVMLKRPYGVARATGI